MNKLVLFLLSYVSIHIRTRSKSVMLNYDSLQDTKMIFHIRMYAPNWNLESDGSPVPLRTITIKVLGF